MIAASVVQILDMPLICYNTFGVTAFLFFDKKIIQLNKTKIT